MCAAGRYRHDEDACQNCPAGYHTAHPEQKICSECTKGKFSDVVGANSSHMCQNCPAGTYSSEEGQSSENMCIRCGRGQYQPLPGQTNASSCTVCPGGKYSNISGASICQECPAGFIEPNKGTHAGSHVDCEPCPADFPVARNGSTFCRSCLAGRYFDNIDFTECAACPSGWKGMRNSSGDYLCIMCGAGYSQKLPGEPFCLPCTPGKANNQTGQAECTNCSAGMFSANQIAEHCRSCPRGYYQPDNTSASCLPCNPGMFTSHDGALWCSDCPDGWLQASSGETYCNKTLPGAIVLPGGSASVFVPPGQVIDPKAPSGFRACAPGRYGTKNRTRCLACLPGRSSFNGSIICTPCAKGKFSDVGSTPCKLCPPGFFQPQDQIPSTSCSKCPVGWEKVSGIGGDASCKDLNWRTAFDCENSDVYLDHTHTNQSEWDCADCPRGVSCAGAINASRIQALFGFARCPGHDVPPVFQSCSFAAACLGAPNPMLQGKYIVSGGSDLAKLWHKESCGEGYRPRSFLCGRCDEEYSYSSLSGKCDRCPEVGANVAVAVAGMIAGVAALVIYVIATLSDEGSLDNSAGAKSIGLSYFQVLALLATFPVPWPAIFVTLVHMGGAVTVMGTHLVRQVPLPRPVS